MRMISKRSVTAFLKSKGIDPREFWNKGRPALKLKRRDVRRIEERLLADKLVVLKLHNSGATYEFVHLKYVSMKPRYHFEKPGTAAKAQIARLRESVQA